MPAETTNRAFGFISPSLSSEASGLVEAIRGELARTPLYDGGARIPVDDLIAYARDRITACLVAKAVGGRVERECHLREMSPHKHLGNDCADLVVHLSPPHDLRVVIEFDTIRADQVAKKFVSRVALVPKPSTVYVAFCYPGTPTMVVNEVIKYFNFMESLAKDLGMAGCLGFVPPAS